MAETYIQMFCEKFYPEIFLETSDKTIKNFEKNKDKIASDWEKGLRAYMEQLVRLQESNCAENIAEIDISFLFTSMTDNPVFQIDSYEEGGRALTKSRLTAYLSADWMVAELDTMAAALLNKAKEEKMQRYIRAAEAETLKLRAARSLLYYFALRFKYMVPKILDMRSLAKVKKADDFVFQIGEYMDWQKTIYAVFPEVDIFNCDRKTDLRFRNFPAVFYKDKLFQNINLSQSKFQDCTFHDVSMVKCKMDDCTFDGCSFANVRMEDLHMAGSIFIHCTFKQTQIKNVRFIKDGTKEEEPDYFEPAEFYKCTFEGTDFTQCDMRRSFVTDCEINGLTIDDCCVEGSDFVKNKDIVWKASVEKKDEIL